ncbi:MAG: rhodanese-like domain-containing protein [Hyphomicrobiales bacterium]|nr:rhodanese-like domain-containing protein [Hyphomicrobiales bacterium]
MKIGQVRTAAVAAILVVVVAVLIAVGYYGVLMSGLDPENPNVTLADIENTVSQLYPAPEIEAKNLAEKTLRGDTVVFDVRERAEFDQGHIEGAVHLPPDTTPETFIADHGTRVAGKTIVFYCAVGVRSGIMHNRVKDAISPFSPSATYNMRGGIFRWFAEGRAITSKDGPAKSIHPYDEAWGRLLTRTTQSPRS